MRTIDAAAIRQALLDVGVRKGALVYVQSDLRRVGLVQGVRSQDEFCAAYLDCLLDLVGPEGTVVVPTYTPQVARYDLDFIPSATPSPMGIFAEYVRTRPAALRSLHPIVSFAALGRLKSLICADNGPTGFGWDSPFHRMLENDMLAVTIGLDPAYVIGSAHHIETVFNLPYVYNKLLKWRPIIDGTPWPTPFFMTVRWLNLDVVRNHCRWVDALKAEQGMHSVPLGSSWVHGARYQTSFRIACELVRQDPFFMLDHPPRFVFGEVPFDGPSGRREGIDEAAAADFNWLGLYLRGRAEEGVGEDITQL